MFDEDVMVIGAVPPPVGGVRISVFRITHWLSDLTGKKTLVDLGDGNGNEYLDELKSGGWLIHNLLSWHTPYFVIKHILGSYVSNRSTLVNVHSRRNVVSIYALVLKLFGRRFLLVPTIHSFREDVTLTIRFLNIPYIALLRMSDKVLVTNTDILNKIVKLGVEEKNILVSQAYLKPVKYETSQMLSENLEVFVTNKKYILSGNASYLSYYKGEDLYGLDMLIDMMDEIVKDGLSVGLIFALSPAIEQSYITRKRKQIQKLNLQGSIVLHQSNDSLIPILEKSDIFLRPTNTDGDSISVREAISLNVRVIASDCVERPKGVHLHKNRDVDDLIRQVKIVLDFVSETNEISSLINAPNEYISNLLSVE